MEIREVLRRWQAKQGIREIARATGLDRKTVRRYTEWAEALGLDASSALTDDVVHLVSQGVQERPVAPRSEARQTLDPHREAIKQWISGGGDLDRPLRLTKVHTLLKRKGVDVTYATLRRYVMDEFDWRKRKPTVLLADPDPGQEAQIDFGLMGKIVDATTGKKRKLWVLIVTLPFSRHQFVWPTFTQTTRDVCEGLDAAWWFFEGVVLRVIPDNMKAVVTKADGTDPKLNDAFKDYSEARGLFIDLARVRRPKDKARVENQVAYVRESWFDGEEFDGLSHARESAAWWCREVAGTRIHGRTRQVPGEVYERLEKPQMQPAPTGPFDIPLWTEAKVHPDHHINVALGLYSVPTCQIGRMVRVRADSQIVRIYWRTELIKTHPRQPPGGRSTDPDDYPVGKAECAMRSVDHLIKRAHSQGKHVGRFVEGLLDRPLPWTGMRRGYELLSACKKFGPDRVDQACARAIDFEVYDVKRVKRMLQRAQRFEEEAQAEGKLRPLSSAPRFARTAKSFETLPQEEEQ